MNTTLLIFIILTLHFIGDWVLQPRSRAKSKKANTSDLLNHIFNEVVLYLIVSSIVICLSGYINNGIGYWFISNVLFHLLIDHILPAGKTERQMINYTALDQILHIGCLLLTLEYFIL